MKAFWLGKLDLPSNALNTLWLHYFECLGCLSSISYSISINGYTTPFFTLSWGIHQGFCLSPYLFLLVAEGPSRMLLEEKSSWSIHGLSFDGGLSITHFLFIDDIILISNGLFHEGRTIFVILELFFKETYMVINEYKCVNYFLNLEAHPI